MFAIRIAASFCLMHMLFQAAAALATRPQTIRYSISSNGAIAGHEVDTYQPDGRVESNYEFNDRGRGPKITAVYVLDAAGLPIRVEETGNDYLKAPVDEHFEVTDGIAHWKSTAENGQAAAGAFYVSNNGSAAETAFLVAALAKAQGAAAGIQPAD